MRNYNIANSVMVEYATDANSTPRCQTVFNEDVEKCLDDLTAEWALEMRPYFPRAQYVVRVMQKDHWVAISTSEAVACGINTRLCGLFEDRLHALEVQALA